MNTSNRYEKRKQRTRTQLKECALNLLLEKGYTDLTIQDITDCADLARGTFYVHFGDKDEIVWSLLRDSMNSLTEETLYGLKNVPYLRRKYVIWVKTFAYAQENRALLQVLIGDKGHPVFTLKVHDLFSEVIEKALAEGIFPTQPESDPPISFMAQFMTGALVRLMLWSLETEYTPEQLGQMFYETLYHEPMPPEFLDPISDS